VIPPRRRTALTRLARPLDRPRRRPLRAGLIALLLCLPAAALHAQPQPPASAATDTPTPPTPPDVAAVAAEPGPVSLQPRWRAGQSATYTLWSRQRVEETLTVRDRTRTVNRTVTSELELDWDVLRVTPGGDYVCRMTTNWITAELTGPDGETITFDTRTGRGDGGAMALFRAILAEPITATIRPDGEIVSVSGVEAVQRRTGGASPTEAEFRETIHQLLGAPAAPASITPGQTWSARPSRTRPLGEVTLDWELELAGVEDVEGVPVAVVQGRTTDMTMDPTLEAPAPARADVTLEEGEAGVQVYWDLDRHELVGRHAIESRTVRVEVTGPAASATQTRSIETTTQVLRTAEGDA